MKIRQDCCDSKTIKEIPFLKAIQEPLKSYNLDEFFATCLSCNSFENELCKLNGMRPPPHVIVNACECYQDKDEIPF